MSDSVSNANIRDASLILGYSPPTLRKFIAQGMPVQKKGGRGKDYVLNLPQCIEWMADQKVRAAVGDVTTADVEELKKRKLAAETTITEIEAATARGDVVYISESLRAFTHEALAVKARILATPQRLAAALAGITEQREIKRILTDELHSAFEELSARSIDVDSVLSGGHEPDGEGEVATATKPAAQRVGRGKRTDTGGKRKAR